MQVTALQVRAIRTSFAISSAADSTQAGSTRVAWAAEALPPRTRLASRGMVTCRSPGICGHTFRTNRPSRRQTPGSMGTSDHHSNVVLHLVVPVPAALGDDAHHTRLSIHAMHVDHQRANFRSTSSGSSKNLHHARGNRSMSWPPRWWSVSADHAQSRAGHTMMAQTNRHWQPQRRKSAAAHPSWRTRGYLPGPLPSGCTEGPVAFPRPWRQRPGQHDDQRPWAVPGPAAVSPCDSARREQQSSMVASVHLLSACNTGGLAWTARQFLRDSERHVLVAQGSPRARPIERPAPFAPGVPAELIYFVI